MTQEDIEGVNAARIATRSLHPHAEDSDEASRIG